MLDIQAKENGIFIQVLVIPGSSCSYIVGVVQGALKIKLNSPPVEGKANQECIKLLSKTFKIPKSSISIIKGQNSKTKWIFFEGNPQYLKDKAKNVKIR